MLNFTRRPRAVEPRLNIACWIHGLNRCQSRV
jgi:hypothetical protein